MSSTKRLLHRWFGLSADEHGGMKAVAADPDVSLEVINLGTFCICTAVRVMCASTSAR